MKVFNDKGQQVTDSESLRAATEYSIRFQSDYGRLPVGQHPVGDLVVEYPLTEADRAALDGDVDLTALT